MLLIKQNKKKSKDQNASEWNYGWKNRNDRSACVNILSEHLLTDKFPHYLRMNSTSYCWSYIDFYTVTFLYYLHFTYTGCIGYFIIYWFLRFATAHVFHCNSNNRINDAWGGFFWKSISLNEIFSFWKPKISFTEMFNESIENQFNWNLMLRYAVKSTLKVH